jgi:hypothetical protein
MATPNNNDGLNGHHEQQILDEKLGEIQRPHSETSSTTKLEDSEGAGAESVTHNDGHAHPRFGANRVISADKDAEDLPNVEKAGTYDKIELTEDMCYDELGYSFPEWKKW